ELETKRILLEIFKERQQRNAQAGSVPSFYKKACQLNSFWWCPLQFYQYIQLQKQSELLLNADDLDAMWVRLRENCVIDDATGAEKVEIHVFPEQ
ncbi:hypothetical protein BHE74_00031006, partial [Ensete ventricosum]